MGDFAGGVTGIFFLIVIHFIPLFIAVLRNHRNMGPIAAVNVLLGWTVLGWIGAFVWSLTANTEPKK